MTQHLAVLTGDLIDSSALPAAQLDRAMAALQRAAREVSLWQNGGASTRFTRSGGDGWQICLSTPRFALRAALHLRAALMSEGEDFQTRFSIATGTGTLPDKADLNSAHGPAFAASGRGLRAIKRHATMTHADGGALAAAVRLADHISQGWTPAQARSVHLMLWPRDRTRADAAAEIGITRQAVDQALWGAGFPAIQDALTLIEARENHASE